MNEQTSGKFVFWALFAVAIGYSVSPGVGVLVGLVILALFNRAAIVRAVATLEDAAARTERQLEQRGISPERAKRVLEQAAARVTASAPTAESVTAVSYIKKDTTAVTPPPASTPASSVTAVPYSKKEPTAVTLPTTSSFDPAAPRPAPLAVPLGLDQNGAFRWLDFGKDALHVGLFGTSGCGKDHLLRLWFAALQSRSDVRWAVLDGKGDWLTPNLRTSPAMLFPPAGGYGEEGQQRILAAIRVVNEEAKRRFGLLLDAGVRSVDEYNAIAQEKIPLLIVLATDIIDVVDETETLLIALVSKARALGIRVIASMQTPTGKRMEWRMNLSTLIAGALVDSSQDAPALGVRDPKTLLFRPSSLPPPPGERGVFVVRHNHEQFVIRTPELRRGFDATINDAALLRTLLSVVPSADTSASVRPSVPKTDENEPEGDLPADTSARTAALRALIDAGLSREQARAAGVKFSNQEWSLTKRKM